VLAPASGFAFMSVSWGVVHGVGGTRERQSGLVPASAFGLPQLEIVELLSEPKQTWNSSKLCTMGLGKPADNSICARI